VNDFETLPIDPVSTATLTAHNLRFATVDSTANEAVDRWLGAIDRGFFDARATDDRVAARRLSAVEQRKSGVWDPTAAEPHIPVATIAAWHTELTVPGGVALPAWAISGVTVSPTHRRRGIAREMVCAELRTAKALDLPVAVLTVSESTIYSRWGFAPAVLSADWTIATDRVRWIGPVAPGRVHFVGRQWVLTNGFALVERVRLDSPGQTEFHGVLWERLLAVGDDTATRSLRCVRYDDVDGVAQGFATYRVLDE